MGMFDYVKCLYPLPENPPADKAFQTTDLANTLMDYTITEDGHLCSETGEDRSHFTGTIAIYWSNVAASGPGLYTRTGEHAHFLEYAITFVDGKVTRVEEIRNDYQPALPWKPNWKQPSEEERKRTEERQKESLTGRSMWLWWGSHETGYAVTVVAENSRELVVQGEDERFEIVARSSRDGILFDSYEAGKRHNDERKAAWERERKEYEDAVQQRAAKEKQPGKA